MLKTYESTIIERSFVYPQRKPPLLLTDTRGKSVESRMRRTKYRMPFRCIVLVSLKTPPPATLLPAKCHETSEIGKLIHIFSIDDNAADRPLSFHRIRITRGMRAGWVFPPPLLAIRRFYSRNSVRFPSTLERVSK